MIYPIERVLVSVPRHPRICCTDIDITASTYRPSESYRVHIAYIDIVYIYIYISNVISVWYPPLLFTWIIRISRLPAISYDKQTQERNTYVLGMLLITAFDGKGRSSVQKKNSNDGNWRITSSHRTAQEVQGRKERREEGREGKERGCWVLGGSSIPLTSSNITTASLRLMPITSRTPGSTCAKEHQANENVAKVRRVAVCPGWIRRTDKLIAFSVKW